MSHSFCIITNGKRAELLGTVVRSIQAQKISEYEIIIAGIHHGAPGIVFLPAADAANCGRLGEMRNLAVARARFEHVVMLDDDIILAPDWYRAFTAYDRPFDILTSQIRLPDGGRYYDHATTGGPKGQAFLAEGEDDDYVYMTGGGGWVMKDYVAKSVAWDPARAFYQGEDVDFSRRCQARGFKISHNHSMVVYHADPTYTSIGKSLRRRKDGRSHEWVLNEFKGLSTFGILRRVVQLRRSGLKTEAVDFIRMAILRGKCTWMFKIIWQGFIFKSGGDLPDTSWSPAGSSDYLKTLDTYRSLKS
jgi:GT2 family glycosyltransferase